MYLDLSLDRVRAASLPDVDEIHPCSPEEVEALEAKLETPLPAALREFLFWCGKGLGEVWSGARCLDYDELLSQFGLDEARSTLASTGQEDLLQAGKALVFQYDEDGQFSFVRLDEGEDPPVYTFVEGEGLAQSAEHFSQYVDLILRQEFGVNSDDDPGTQGVEASYDPSHGQDPNIVPPERRSAPDLREASFGFLPPHIQGQLGSLRASFTPSPANLLAGAIFGVLFLVFGLVLMVFLVVQAAKLNFNMPLFAQKNMSWLIFAVAELLSTGMAVMGLLMLLKLRKTLTARLFLGDKGLCQANGSNFELASWSGLVEIQELLIKDAAPLKHIGSLIPAGTDSSYNLRLKDGRELLVNSTNVRKLALLREILARVSSLHHVPWKVIESRRLS